MLHSQKESFYPGQEIIISFRLKHFGQVVLNGIIVWAWKSAHNPDLYEAGVRWTRNSPAAQARLAAFLSSHLDAPAVPTLVSSSSARSIGWWRMITFGFLLFALLTILNIFWFKKGILFAR